MNSPDYKSLVKRLDDLQKENHQLREENKRLDEQNRNNAAYPDLFLNYKKALEDGIRNQTRCEIYSRLLKSLIGTCEKMAAPRSTLSHLLKNLKPPKLTPLGGKEFPKAIEVHAKGGENELAKLLSQTGTNEKLYADVYTVIARENLKKNPDETVRLALRAWEINPRLYRLKWLAFRMHEAGKALEAEALLDLLGNSVLLDEKEKARIEKIREDCANLRSCADLPLNSDELSASLEFQDDIPADPEIQLKGIFSMLKKLTLGRSKEIAFLLDCMDEQKDVIQKCSQDAWLNLLGNIREEIAPFVHATEGNLAEESEAGILRRQLALLRLGAYNKYGILPGDLELLNTNEIEYVLLVLDMIAAGKYQYIINFGIGPSTIPLLSLIKGLNSDPENPPIHFLLFSESEKELKKLKGQFSSVKDCIFCQAPLEKSTNEKAFYDINVITKALQEYNINKDSNVLTLINNTTKKDFSAYPAFAAVLLPCLQASHDFILPSVVNKEEPNLLAEWQRAAKTLGQNAKVENLAGNAEILLCSQEIK